VTWLIYIHCDVTHSVTWLIHIQCHMYGLWCDMTHLHPLWHILWLIDIHCDITHSHSPWRDSFCDMTHSHPMSHVTWLICDMSNPHPLSDPPWLIDIHCDMTHSHSLWRDSLCVTWLIHIHCHMYCAPLRAPQGKIVGVPAQSLIGSAGSCTRTLHARVLVPSEVQNCFWYGVPVPRRTLYITASRAVSDRECGKLYTHTPCQSPGTHQNVVHYIFPRSLWQGVREAVHAHFMSETLYPRRSRTVFDMESRYPEERCTL